MKLIKTQPSQAYGKIALTKAINLSRTECWHDENKT
jgi:hypothetical protein